MLIPSIDLMGGKIVQLVQGKTKALEFDDFEEWIQRFSKYPLVQLIDLDAATGKGSNAALVRDFARRLPCQVGGGLRAVEPARAALDLGARRVILGSSLIANGAIDSAFAQRAASELGVDKLVFAVDSKAGYVSIRGWQQTTSITALEMIRLLQPYCAAFLYTHIDTEGMLQGFPIELARHLRDSTSNQVIVAGGIRSQDEVDRLDSLGVDAVVGMAIYTGLMKV
jgi:phosphoribosylformimino-5-aminoimidazole carboxamide ribotide isomerase